MERKYIAFNSSILQVQTALHSGNKVTLNCSNGFSNWSKVWPAIKMPKDDDNEEEKEENEEEQDEEEEQKRNF
jgi:hypothetical protein